MRIISLLLIYALFFFLSFSNLRISFPSSLDAFAAIVGSAKAESLSNREFVIKGAFLYNFGVFTEWPPEASSSQEKFFSLCIIGNDPFGVSLNVALKDKTIRNQQITIKHSKEGSELKSCKILFINTPAPQIKSILQKIHDVPVLTVSDHEDFNKLGGSIQFVIKDEEVKFRVNLNAIRQAKLKVNSKVLNLAMIYQEERE